jgi:hypothetical protein
MKKVRTTTKLKDVYAIRDYTNVDVHFSIPNWSWY